MIVIIPRMREECKTLWRPFVRLDGHIAAQTDRMDAAILANAELRGEDSPSWTEFEPPSTVKSRGLGRERYEGSKMTLGDFSTRQDVGMLRAITAVGLCLAAQVSSATVIRFEFSVGEQPFGTADFRLFDTAMPRSVENFLNYLDRYEGTFLHRNPRNAIGGPDGNFVVQGGGFEFVPPSSAPPIPVDPAIADEPGGGVQGISNLRGTLSNAKSGPNTVTSQWFVNLSDNSFLDSPARADGGFAAFGRVLGDGIMVFDAIDLLAKRDLDPVPNMNLFNDVPVGDVNDPLGTLVILNAARVLDIVPGDYNFDGQVTLADYTVWRDTLGSTTLAEADGNGNGVVDAADYAVWKAHLGQQSAAPPATGGTAIPEPNGLVIAAMAIGLWCARAR